MTGLEEGLRRAGADLDAVGAKWAIIGGGAGGSRGAPRFTQDVVFAVSVADDAEAEDIVHRMSVRGYAVGMMLEQDYVHRLATIRLIRPVPGKSQVFVDLLFGSSGIEDQVVACADRLPAIAAEPDCRGKRRIPGYRNVATDRRFEAGERARCHLSARLPYHPGSAL